MSVERPAQIDEIDYSIDSRVIAKAEEILGNPKITPETANKWIHSPVKAAFERITFGLIGSLTAPITFGLMAGVQVVDGWPVLDDYDVGYLGLDNEFVGIQRLYKVRSLVKNTPKADAQPPHTTSLYKGGRARYRPDVDSRVHSRYGGLLRKSSVDELPQLWAILLGTFAGVGGRAYTLSELKGIKEDFIQHDLEGNVFPDNFPTDYRAVVSRVQPKPALFSLYTATLRKALTMPERLTLDYLYFTKANPLGDVRIIRATIENVLQAVGAR